MAHAANQCIALCLIYLVCFDGTLARNLTQGGEASFSQGAVQAAQQDRADETGLEGSDSDGPDEDADEAAVLKYEQLEDPHKPMVSGYRSGGKGIREAFSRITGYRGKKADEFYAEAVRKVIPDDYIAEGSQFALCARTSSSVSEKKDASISLRCTPTMNLLPAVTQQDRSGRFNFKDVWKAFRDVVKEVKVPNINWSNGAFSNAWRAVSNSATGKKDRFLREQSELDLWFKDYFGAQAKASSLSFRKESIQVDPKKLQQLMSFDSAVGSTTVSMTSSSVDKQWPGKDQPTMGSRYVMCFGRLSKPGKTEMDPQRMATHCTGFWNKHSTKDAIEGLGNSMGTDDTRLFRDATLYQTRMEILYGRSSHNAQASAFKLAGRSPSAKNLARTLAKLIRERVAAEGLECEPCAAAALGIKGPKGSSGQSLVQTNATGSTFVCPWLFVGSEMKTGVWHLTLDNGVITSQASGIAAGGGVVIGGTAFPPALIVVGIIVILHVLKNVAVAARKAYMTVKKLKKWQALLADKRGRFQSMTSNSSILELEGDFQCL